MQYNLKLIPSNQSILQLKPIIIYCITEWLYHKFFEELHHRLVVTPFYKPNENIAVVCKRFGVLTLMKERGLSGSYTSIPKKYETCVGKTNDQLINSYTKTVFTYLC